MSKQNNEALVRKIYDAWADRDFKAYLDLLSDDIIYHAAGNCPFSGIHKGKEAVIKMGQLALEIGGTQRVVFKQLIANDSHVAVIDRWTAEREAKTVQMDNLLVYKIESGKITEIWEFIEDEVAHDDFWA